MNRFTSYDGTVLAFRAIGAGKPLICLPGGPGRAIGYLGDLGGLAGSRQLILLDPRGVGGSADADPATYRCDRQTGDVEALRAHLGLDRIDLLGHSAGANLALLYAAAHPHRVDRLVLLTPSLRAAGIVVTAEQERAAMERRSGQTWYEAAVAAVERADAGDESDETVLAFLPFYYGHWDAAARAHAFVGVSDRSRAVREAIFREGAFDPARTRAALSTLPATVLIYAGELDCGPTPALAREAARLFRDAQVMVQPQAAHFPWVDDPARFAEAIAGFLG